MPLTKRTERQHTHKKKQSRTVKQLLKKLLKDRLIHQEDDVLQVLDTYSGRLLLDGRALCFSDTRQTASEKKQSQVGSGDVTAHL
ncbi:hypothetical protein QQF64_030522 [Cirrhinus molitorella]|uniref:Uncharacterized protein n=1 Tax=Cirrhinus molitorella TaxID=172907 RepID=A0ABR3N3X5_9TELE